MPYTNNYYHTFAKCLYFKGLIVRLCIANSKFFSAKDWAMSAIDPCSRDIWFEIDKDVSSAIKEGKI